MRRHFKTYVFLSALLALGFFVQMSSSVGAAGTPAVIFLTSGTTWTVPSDWNNSNNTIEVIGGGGGGGTATAANGAGGGGGGGAYASIYNLTLTPNSTVTYQIGAGGAAEAAGGDTYFKGTGTTCSAQSVCAKGGSAGNGLANNTGGAGGTTAGSVGTVITVGGQGTKLNGGNSNSGGGGGGAAGPKGAGAAGGSNSNSASNNSGTGGGGNGSGGAGAAAGTSATGSKGGAASDGTTGGLGGAANTAGSPGSSGSGGGGGGRTSSNTLAAGSGGAGGAGNEWTATNVWNGTSYSGTTPAGGSGGGAGGGGGRVSPNTGAGGNGGAGGNYGGGGGGGGWTGGSTLGVGGAGAPGIIVIKYNTPLNISLASSTAGPLTPGQTVTFTVTRNGPPPVAAQAVNVTLGGTAVNGTHYSITNVSGGVVTIPIGSNSQTMVLTASSTIPSSKTFTLTLPTNAAYTLVAPTSYSTTLMPMPALSISGSLNETTGVVTVVWSSTNTTSCTVTGPNSFSASGTSGSQTTTPGSTPATYTMTCATPVGSKQSSAVVTASGTLKVGLINYWSMDGSEVTGGTSIKDVGPNMCSPGTLYNAPTATTGHYGTAATALAFNGSNTYIEAPPVGISNTISVSAWVKATNFNQNGVIVEKEAFNTQWALLFESGLLKWRGGSATEITTALPSNNAWHHIVATQSGTTAKLYVDGVLAKTGTVTAIGNDINYYNYLEIGRYNSGYYFNGSIDELMVYNIELTPSQVSQLYTLAAVSATALHTTNYSATGAGPVIEPNAGYTAAPFGSYGMPVYSDNLSNEWSGNSDNRPEDKTQPLQAAGTPADVSSGWYDDTPSPLTCFATAQSLQGLGSCLYLGNNTGTRVAAITATPSFPSLPQAIAALQNGLVGFWSLDSGDISGTSVIDSAGGNNGTSANSPTPVSGHYGDAANALSFNGTSKRIDNSVAPTTVLDNWTLSAWINPAALSVNSSIAVYNGTDAGGYGFGIGPAAGTGTGSLLQGLMGNAGWINSGYTFPSANQWYHVVMVRASGTTKFYVNGAQTSNTSATTPKAVKPKFSIGMEYDSSNAPSRYFSGSIDEVMIYNRALSAAEISQLYAMTQANENLLQGGSVSPQSAGLDIVSTNPVGACGIPTTHWSYAATGASTLLVPKYTQVDFSYSCQPSQEYLWSQNRDYSCWPVSCNASTISQRVFRFADRAKVNGNAAGSLSGTATKTISSPSTFTLQCGGYVPEEGTQLGLRPLWAPGTDGFGSDHPIDDFNGDFQQADDPIPQNVGLPPFYSADRHPACWNFCYWPWTWAYYNAASSTYYQPPASLTVLACNENEIVVNNTCRACPAGQYRSGNMCTSTAPPSGTIDAGAGHSLVTGDGIATTTVVGAPITITATYTSGTPAIVKTTYLTSGTSWTVPADWNNSNNTIEVIGGGGSGGVSRQGSARYGAGGGGGGYAKATNVTLTTGASVMYAIGGGGVAVSRTTNGNTVGNVGGDTYFCNSTSNCASISGTAVLAGAKGGAGGGAANSGSVTAAAGGAVTAAKGGAGGGILNPGGVYAYAGGAGGAANAPGTQALGTGGGGAGGPGGAGSAGVSTNTGGGTNGGAGGAGSGGAAGAGGGTATVGVTSSGAGGAGAEWDATHGSGGGAGGLRTIDTTGSGTAGSGGAYGGGGGGVSGNSNTQTSGAGAPGIVVITYITGDPLVATAINDDSTNTGVDCGSVKGFDGTATTTYITGSGCENKPDVAKVYSFIPSFSDVGTHVFSAQIKTSSYGFYNSYASVSVTVTCWDHAHQVGNSCVCDPHYSQQGNSCVLDECTNNAPFPGIQATVPPGCVQSTDGNFTCSPIPGSGYVAGGGECAPPGTPANIMLNFSPSRVRSGSNTTVTWTGTNVPAECTITSNPPVPGLPMDVPSTITGNSTGVSIGPITQNTNITLTCPSVVSGNGTAKKAVGLVPVYQEI